MSRSMNSPTARLLQSSRLFSLPRPLPQPNLDTVSSTGIYRASDTATLPYPTHQAITTPASSHTRGDFGLKRPLPAKATRSSTPHIRVKAHDNFAQITDFGSAADHTQTEAKWRQMVVPMATKQVKTRMSEGKTYRSVYDEQLDNTDRDVVGLYNQSKTRGNTVYGRRNPAATNSIQKERWKYEGPFIAGMSLGEFDLYMMSKVSKRKQEFRVFLQNRMLQKRIHDEERAMREQGEAGTLASYQIEKLRQEVEANYETEEKKLRDEHAVQNLASDLTAAICEFLDLPGVRGDRGPDTRMAQTSGLRSFLAWESESSADKAPPSTHPGAGLSHIRSNAFLENHPLWGPQAQRAPVLARVVRPRNNAQRVEYQAKIGVGGVVTNDIVGSTSKTNFRMVESEDPYDHYAAPDRMADSIDPDLKGGNKIWVNPDTAHIDEKGQIQLSVKRGDQEAIAVKLNRVEPIHEARGAALRSTAGEFAFSTQENANYGYSLPDKRQMAPWPKFGQSKVAGLELDGEALGHTGDAAARVKELIGERSQFSPKR